MILPPDVYCHYLSFGKKNQRQKRAYMTTMIRVNFQTANNLHDQIEFPIFTQWLYWDVPNISYKFLLESTIQWFLVYSVWATQHHNWFRVFSGTKSHLPSSLTLQSLALTLSCSFHFQHVLEGSGVPFPSNNWVDFNTSWLLLRPEPACSPYATGSQGNEQHSSLWEPPGTTQVNSHIPSEHRDSVNQ